MLRQTPTLQIASRPFAAHPDSLRYPVNFVRVCGQICVAQNFRLPSIFLPILKNTSLRCSAVQERGGSGLAGGC